MERKSTYWDLDRCDIRLLFEITIHRIRNTCFKGHWMKTNIEMLTKKLFDFQLWAKESSYLKFTLLHLGPLSCRRPYALPKRDRRATKVLNRLFPSLILLKDSIGINKHQFPSSSLSTLLHQYATSSAPKRKPELELRVTGPLGEPVERPRSRGKGVETE
ncbi:hypothetical protein KPH14_006171 [Odynerus spinipes]|uniref:Uncharacterized protein n=1 Tax=Odynerus spinipes TaxID=1348599 RepID=A0AAD9RIQ5_9HYME|nr:hypothetical protein KPH14_006171 [Odynerus spinipes]